MQRPDVRIALITGLAVLAPCMADVALASPRIAASIAPLAGIAAAVTGETTAITQLIPSHQSPHHGALKPSQVRALGAADVVLWVGPRMETGVDKVLDAQAQSWVARHVMTVTDLPGVTLRPFRALTKIGVDVEKGGIAPDPGHDQAKSPSPQAHGHDHDHDHDHGHDHGGSDPHLWLDPDNAAVIALALADRLATADPGSATKYRENAARFVDGLQALKQKLTTELQPLAGQRFVVFHDAYQYFEVPYGLHATAALTLDPSLPIGGRHLKAVRDQVTAAGVRCIFADVQASSDVTKRLAADLNLRSGVLDPLGGDFAVDSYPRLLRKLAESYRSCLTP